MNYNGYPTTNYPHGVSTTLPATNNGAPDAGGLNIGAVGQFTSITTLTAAQVNALNATPIQLLPAPTSNQFILLHGFALELLFNTTAYVNGNNANLRLNYSNTLATNTFYTLAAGAGFNSVITRNFTNFNYFIPTWAGQLDKATYAGQPLYADISAALSVAGDSPLQITSYFSVIPV